MKIHVVVDGHRVSEHFEMGDADTAKFKKLYDALKTLYPEGSVHFSSDKETKWPFMVSMVSGKETIVASNPQL